MQNVSGPQFWTPVTFSSRLTNDFQAYTKYTLVDNNDNGTTSEYQRQVAYRSGTNTLGIIFFCLSFGTVLGSLGKSGKPVVDFFKIIDEVIMKMVYAIMWWVIIYWSVIR